MGLEDHDYSQRNYSISLNIEPKLKLNTQIQTPKRFGFGACPMYTQISKEILFRIDFQQEYLNKLLTYCRQVVINGNIALENVDKMENSIALFNRFGGIHINILFIPWLIEHYVLEKLISFLKMGFFLRDFHQYTVILHSEQ